MFSAAVHRTTDSEAYVCAHINQASLRYHRHRAVNHLNMHQPLHFPLRSDSGSDYTSGIHSQDAFFCTVSVSSHPYQLFFPH